MSELHPSNITRTRNGKRVELDVCEYLFIHAQRLPCKSMLRPINKLKYASKSRDHGTEKTSAKLTKELTDEVAEDQGAHDNRNLYQRGLGLFNKVVVKDDNVTCTCENYRRFGKCEHSELMGLVCLGEKGYPTDKHAIDFNACKEGFGVLSSRLRDKILNLVGTRSDVQVKVHPPAQDPSSSIIQDGTRSGI